MGERTRMMGVSVPNGEALKQHDSKDGGVTTVGKDRNIDPETGWPVGLELEDVKMPKNSLRIVQVPDGDFVMVMPPADGKVDEMGEVLAFMVSRIVSSPMSLMLARAAMEASKREAIERAKTEVAGHA